MGVFISIGTSLAGLKKLGRKLGIGNDPRKVPDTQIVVNYSQRVNELWERVSGERLPHAGISAYPNVPKGPGGDPAVNIEEIIRQANLLVEEAFNQIQLKKRASANPFFSNRAGGIIGLMERMADARRRSNPLSRYFGELSPTTKTVAAGAATWFLLRR